MRQRGLHLLRRRQQVLREDVEVVYRVFGHESCLRKPASLTRRALEPKSAGPSYWTTVRACSGPWKWLMATLITRDGKWFQIEVCYRPKPDVHWCSEMKPA